MALKDDFFSGTTGLQTQMANAFTAGSTFVTSSLSTLSAALIAQAALGNTKFTVNIITNFNPVGLRGNNGNNLLLKSYLAGIQDGLAGQNVYNYECSPTLNVSDSVNTSIDFNFNFQTT